MYIVEKYTISVEKQESLTEAIETRKILTNQDQPLHEFYRYIQILQQLDISLLEPQAWR